MNHIFKTVFNQNTGVIQAVSEHASGQCKNQSGTITKGKKLIPSQNSDRMRQQTSCVKSTLASSIAFIIATLCSSPAIAQITYTGDSKDLTTSINVGGNFHQLIGNDTAKGVMSTDTPVEIDGVPTVSGHHVIVDYASGTTPDFVIAGYGAGNSNATAETLAITNHTVDLKQGNINGPVYAGLAHVSNISGDIDCSNPVTTSNCTHLPQIIKDTHNKTLSSNHNTIQVLDQYPTQVRGDLFSGYAGVNLQYGDLTATDYHTHIYANSNASNNTLSSHENQISIAGNGYSFNSITSGYTRINLHYGHLNTVYNPDIFINTDIYTIDETNTNTLSSNANQIAITGNDHIFHDLSSGYADITLHDDNLTAANVESDDIAVSDSNAYVMTQTFANNNTLSSNTNQISIAGNDHLFHDINSGYAGLNIQYGNLTAGNANAATDQAYMKANAYAHVYTFTYTNSNSLNSNANQIAIAGNNHRFNNMSTGYAGINLQYGDFNAADAKASINTAYDFTQAYANASAEAETQAHNNTLSSNDNQITIINNKNSINNIAAGYAGINLQYGHLTAGNANANGNGYASASTDTYTNILNSNRNKISITGDQHSINNMSAGYAEINLQYGHLTAGNANTEAYISDYVMANTNAAANTQDNSLSSDANQITMTGNDHSIKDISSGYAGINLHYGDLTAANATVNSHFNASSFASTDANVHTNNNALSSNTNQIDISGNNNHFYDINSGYTRINIQYGDLSAANAYADTTNGPYVSTDAYTKANTDISQSTLSNNANQITIIGNNNSFNSMSSGHAGINIQYGNLTAASANTNSNVNVRGADANAYTDAYINLSDSTLSSNTNQIVISGNNNHINNMSSGYAEINLRYGDLIAGKAIIDGVTRYEKASLEIDAKNTQLSASNNTISLTGSSTIDGSLHSGDINFNIGHGAIQNSDGMTNSVRVHLNDGFIPDKDSKNHINLNGTQAIATHNTISIDGEHHFTNPEATLYGGYLAYNTVNGVAYKPESYDVFTGNTLNYANKTPIRIKEIANFQDYNFTLTPELGNTGTALISAQNVSLGANQNNISTGATTTSDIKVSGIHSGKLVSTGTEFILLKGDNFAGNATGHRATGVIQQGISLLYDVETKVDTANKQVTATILSGHDDPDPKINPGLKSLLEGKLSGLMLLTRSGDNLAYDTLSAITLQNQKKGIVPFVQMSGHTARYNSGSHIDADGALLTAGLSFQNDNLTLALFSENGWDSYNTVNNFNDAASVKANGHNRFNGGGLLGQYDFDNGVYVDAVLRAGRLHTKYQTDDLHNATTGETAHYNLTTDYFGAHAGLGYRFAINTSNDFDLSMKYLWSSTQAKDLIVAGDEIHFDQLNSHRLRLNGENSYRFNKDWSLLTGAGFEYEFDGQATGTTYQVFGIEAPSTKGVTAIGTLGIRYQPANDERLTVDFKGSGYVGEREGGSAMLHMKYAF